MPRRPIPPPLPDDTPPPSVAPRQIARNANEASPRRAVAGAQINGSSPFEDAATGSQAPGDIPAPHPDADEPDVDLLAAQDEEPD